jgi:hypothetical protein
MLRWWSCVGEWRPHARLAVILGAETCHEQAKSAGVDSTCDATAPCPGRLTPRGRGALISAAGEGAHPCGAGPPVTCELEGGNPVRDRLDRLPCTMPRS